VKLALTPLTREDFAAFGDVIETEGRAHFAINQGTAERFHDLARIDMGENGKTLVSIVVGEPRGKPIALSMMERHPLASQAFIPLQPQDYLVVVAQEPLPSSLRGFLAKGTQGVNYRRNVWHHPLLVLTPHSRFLLIDRGGEGNNLEEAELAQTVYIVL
jgi:ureidoglycolate lyase